MKTLKPYGQIKRKEFIRELTPETYILCDALPYKSQNPRHYVSMFDVRRVDQPKGRVFKVIEYDNIELLYVQQRVNVDENHYKLVWKTHEACAEVINPPQICYGYSLKKYNFKNYQLWNMFCENLIENITVMTQEEFCLEHYVDILLEL